MQKYDCIVKHSLHTKQSIYRWCIQFVYTFTQYFNNILSKNIKFQRYVTANDNYHIAQHTCTTHVVADIPPKLGGQSGRQAGRQAGWQQISISSRPRDTGTRRISGPSLVAKKVSTIHIKTPRIIDSRLRLMLSHASWSGPDYPHEGFSPARRFHELLWGAAALRTATRRHQSHGQTERQTTGVISKWATVQWSLVDTHCDSKPSRIFNYEDMRVRGCKDMRMSRMHLLDDNDPHGY